MENGQEVRCKQTVGGDESWFDKEQTQHLFALYKDWLQLQFTTHCV